MFVTEILLHIDAPFGMGYFSVDKEITHLIFIYNIYLALGQALLQTMLNSKIYPHEGMLSAKVEYECRMRGAQRMA